MECRRSLLVAFGLLSAVAGCVTTQTIPPTISAPPPATPAATAPPTAARPASGDPDKVRPPKPATCVAAGVAFEAEARDPRCDPGTRDRLRDQARRAYLQAIEVDANHLAAYEKLGNLCSSLGDYEQAKVAFEGGLKKAPREGALWYGLGMCYARQKDWERAASALGKAVECDPENRQYLNTLGHCHARAGRIEESLGCFRRSVGEAKAHYNVARMLHHLKQDEAARQHVQQALQAEPTLEPARLLLAQLDGRAPEGAAAASLDSVEGR
jgi:tetratricopeptide (TPR) repeat protein